MAVLAITSIVVLLVIVKPTLLFARTTAQFRIAPINLSRDPKLKASLLFPTNSAKVLVSSRSSLIVLAGDCGSCSKWSILPVTQEAMRAGIRRFVLTESEPSSSFQDTVKGLGYEVAMKDQWGLHRAWNAAFRPRVYHVTRDGKLSWIQLPTDKSLAGNIK